MPVQAQRRVSAGRRRGTILIGFDILVPILYFAYEICYLLAGKLY